MVSAFLDYRLPFASAVSVNLGVRYLGDRPGSADNQLVVPARTFVDLGARYRFRLGTFPATARLQITNLLNRYAWDVSDFGGFKRAQPRREQLTLSADF
jgi:iron complex outermembrane receptor protein